MSKAQFTLTPEQRATFERDGVVRLERFFSRELTAAMADALWADLARRHGIERDRPETWTVARPMHFQRVRQRGAFAGLDTPQVAAVCDALLGAGNWTRPTTWGQPLVTFPDAAASDRLIWHFDLPGQGYPWPLPLLRLFTFVEPSDSGGGGTLYVQGSHRVAMQAAKGMVASAKLRRRIAARAWFAALDTAPPGAHRAMLGQTSEVDGVAVGVRQMTGEAGDAILMHPLILHSGVANDADRPRMMLVDTILARRLDAAKAGPDSP